MQLISEFILHLKLNNFILNSIGEQRENRRGRVEVEVKVVVKWKILVFRDIPRRTFFLT